MDKRGVSRVLAGTALVLLALGSSNWMTDATAKAQHRGAETSVSPEMIVTGVVANDSGRPVGGAYVCFGGTVVAANVHGVYVVKVKAALRIPVLLWAPGYQQLGFDFTPGVIPPGVSRFDIGPARLDSAYTSSVYHASLAGLPPVLNGRPQTANLHGRSQYPVQSTIYVTLPNGSVRFYGLRRSGASFWGKVPFKSKGVYQVEIAATSGISMFNIPVFNGVRPSLQTGPRFPTDPTHAGQQALDSFGLRLVNQVRAAAGLRGITMDPRLRAAAVDHTTDMARYGYYESHPHIGSDGSTLAQRLRRAGLRRYRSISEDIGCGLTVGNAMDGLFLSPQHRLSLMGSYTRAGVGVARWNNDWLVTIDLAR